MVCNLYVIHIILVHYVPIIYCSWIMLPFWILILFFLSVISMYFTLLLIHSSWPPVFYQWNVFKLPNSWDYVYIYCDIIPCCSGFQTQWSYQCIFNVDTCFCSYYQLIYLFLTLCLFPRNKKYIIRFVLKKKETQGLHCTCLCFSIKISTS